MPHPFLPLLWQLPSSHHSHGGAQGGQGRAATSSEQLGPEAGQGALQGGNVLFTGSEDYAWGRGEWRPLPRVAAVALICMIRRSWGE